MIITGKIAFSLIISLPLGIDSKFYLIITNCACTCTVPFKSKLPVSRSTLVASHATGIMSWATSLAMHMKHDVTCDLILSGTVTQPKDWIHCPQ